MKFKMNILRIALISMFSATLFFGCNKMHDPMAEEMQDWNNKITSLDLSITKPGDTVTVTGSNLDEVFKIMLNEEVTPVKFYTTSSSELKFGIPSSAPLGDVIVVNFLFQGKGIAQRTIRIFSPPQIAAISPIAGHAGDEITLLGRELYLAEKITVGDAEATFELIDDKKLTLKLPAGFTGGTIVIETEDGTQTVSDSLILGTEILITNFDDPSIYTTEDDYGAYSNASSETVADAFPRGNVHVITIEDNASTWGANCDFTLIRALPAKINGVDVDLNKVEMVADMKASKELAINFMVGKAHNPPGLWGTSVTLNQEWQTITVPFTALGQGYTSDPITTDPLIPFEEYTLIKWSLPAQSDAGNFGETITADNVKFIIRD